MLDNASDVFPSALIYVGKPAFSSNVADYKLAADMLQKVRKDIKLFTNNGHIADLAVAIFAWHWVTVAISIMQPFKPNKLKMVSV